jgi:hypothetical protein
VARSFKCHFQSPVFRRGCPRIGQLPITGKARAVINARVIADLRVSVTFAERRLPRHWPKLMVPADFLRRVLTARPISVRHLARGGEIFSLITRTRLDRC